jgi:hypothetical protein
MKYTDPSGNDLVGAVLGAIGNAVGMIGSGTVNLPATTYCNGTCFGSSSVSYASTFAQAAGGFISGVAGFGNAISAGQAGKAAGDRVGAAMPRPLTKSILTNYITSQIGPTSDGVLQDLVGTIFENTFHDWEADNNSAAYYHPNVTPFYSILRGKNVVPDGIASVMLIDYAAKKEPLTFYSDAAWFEVKASNGTLTKSSYGYQIGGMVDALANNRPEAVKQQRAMLTFVTTSDTKVGRSLNTYAGRKGVNLYQKIAYYKMENGKMLVGFSAPVPLRTAKPTIYWPFRPLSGFVPLSISLP